jgi:hypothetical protein
MRWQLLKLPLRQCQAIAELADTPLPRYFGTVLLFEDSPQQIVEEGLSF